MSHTPSLRKHPIGAAKGHTRRDRTFGGSRERELGGEKEERVIEE